MAAAIVLTCACDGRSSGSSDAGGAAGPNPIVVDRLTQHFGCDENFVAKDSESTVVLGVGVPGVLKRALEAELPYREELTVGPTLDIRLEQGADLDHWCTDMLARPPRIDATWAAREGRATVTVLERAPAPAGYSRVPTRASIALRDLVLQRPGTDETLVVPTFTIEATIGVPAGG